MKVLALLLPNEFKNLVIESLGSDNAVKLFTAIQDEREFTSIRLNTFKNLDTEGLCFKENIFEPVKWCNSGYYIKERPQFTLDPLFHAGGYYVQEASSMYMNLVANAIEEYCVEHAAKSFFCNSLRILDLCAAPGGKTTHLLSLIGEDSLLVSNEVIKSRAIILADNVAKWGAKNVIVTNNDPKDFSTLNNFFDFVIVDAPCSGEGLFRKDKNAIAEWSLANVKLCSERQKRILSDIWHVLKPGGFMVYSTCTYNHYENDDNIKFITEQLAGEVIKINIPPNSGIIRTSLGGLQFIPGLVSGEGQFIVLVRKSTEPNGNINFSYKNKQNKKNNININDKLLANSFVGKICDLNGLRLVPNEFVKGYPIVLMDDILFLERNLRVILSGIAIATIKGKDFIPHADLALSQVMHNVIKKNIELPGICVVEVNKCSALKFLAKEPLVFEGKPIGYLLLVYNGFGLGFVKNLGSRSNNLLPMARRIRMSIVAPLLSYS
ncbi:MAG: rRNA cytosine-C5-methyltransferase [Bacteroidales bacterium]